MTTNDGPWLVAGWPSDEPTDFTSAGYTVDGWSLRRVAEARLTTGGLVIRQDPHPEPQTPEATTPSDDTLAAIDATIDGMCACGCGVKLDPNGPSAWFAFPSCQARWNAQRVGAPLDPMGDAGPMATRALDISHLLDNHIHSDGIPSMHGRVLFVGGSRHGQIMWDSQSDPPPATVTVFVPPDPSNPPDCVVTETYRRMLAIIFGQFGFIYVCGPVDAGLISSAMELYVILDEYLP